MISFKNFLTEKRRNPEQNPVITNYEALEKYQDDDSIYVHFTNVQKVGLNPKSYFDTPNGIYTFKLTDVWNQMNHNQKLLTFTYGGGKYFKYMYILRSNTKPTNFNYLKQSKYEQYLRILKKSKITPDGDDFDGFVETNEMNNSNASLGKMFYELLKVLSQEMNDLIKIMNLGDIHYSTREMNDPNFNKTRKFDILDVNVNGRKFATLLRMLGINALEDDGKGYMYSQEPYQTVFLSKSYVKVLELHNTRKSEYFYKK